MTKTWYLSPLFFLALSHSSFFFFHNLLVSLCGCCSISLSVSHKASSIQGLIINSLIFNMYDVSDQFFFFT